MHYKTSPAELYQRSLGVYADSAFKQLRASQVFPKLEEEQVRAAVVSGILLRTDSLVHQVYIYAFTRAQVAVAETE